MPNLHVQARLEGIQKILNGAYHANSTMSSASKGAERAAFIDDFLSKVLPSPYRFGTGDATDRNGKRSGQLDVVVEYPFIPSLPIVGTGTSRLYLAESVAAVVEVKSDVAAQWSEVVHTARQLEPLQRQFGATMTMGPPPLPRIPLFVAAYRGWKTLDTVLAKLPEASVDGILVIDPGLFVSTKDFRGVVATGSWALWGLISCLHDATTTLQAASTQPLRYAMDSAG
jgi:hypothetical protein